MILYSGFGSLLDQLYTFTIREEPSLTMKNLSLQNDLKCHFPPHLRRNLTMPHTSTRAEQRQCSRIRSITPPRRNIHTCYPFEAILKTEDIRASGI